MNRFKTVPILGIALSLLTISSTGYSLERLVHLCYHYSTSVLHQAQQQGKNIKLRIFFNNHPITLRPTQFPICKSFVTRQTHATINMHCDWQHSSNSQSKAARNFNCSVSGNPNLRLIDAATTQQLEKKVKREVCIVASVQKGSRNCNTTNSHCMRIHTYDLNSPLTSEPLFFEMQVIRHKDRAACKRASSANIS